jgi:putative ABC transport system permease protein
MILQLSLAWRYLRGRKLRTFLTTLAVVFGVFVVFAMNLILPTVTKAMFISVQGANAVVDFTVIHVTGGSFPAGMLPDLATIDGVRAVSGALTRNVGLPAEFYDHDPKKTDKITTIALVGVDPRAARELRTFALESGRFLDQADTTAAVVTQTLADAIDVEPGKGFRIPTVEGIVELTVVGILPPQLEGGGEEVIVTLAQAQRMAGEPGRINAIGIGISDPTANQAARTAIETGIKSVIGSDYRINSSISGPEAFASIELAQTVFNVFGVLALFMGGFIIFNTFRAVVAERRRDIGMLRAIGASRATVIGTILAEGLMQGLAGSIAGIILGYLVVLGALSLLSPVLGRFIRLDMGTPTASPILILECLALGTGTSLLAALIPARSAGRTTPMEAMRPAVVESGFVRKIGINAIIGAVALAATAAALFSGKPSLIVPGGFLFLAGLALAAPALVGPFAGLFGRLLGLLSRSGTQDVAKGNLKRQPSRVAATASSTMIGLAVIVAAGGLLSSLIMPITDLFQKSLGSDYLFIPPSVMLWNSDVGAGPQFAQRLREIDGVKNVATMRYAPSTAGSQAVSMIGIDPEAFPRVSGLHFMEGNESAYKTIASGRSLIANGVFLMTARVRVGETVTLSTLHGPAEYRVAALATDMLNMKAAAAFVSQSALETDFGKAEDVLIQLDLSPGADEDAAEEAIKATAAEYPQFMLIRGRAYFDTMKDLMGAAFAGLFLLFALLALPSLIATINTLSIGVLERTREIGMIRAVGASRKHVRGMVLFEALLLAAIGTVLGILGGLYLSTSIVSALKDMFPLGYAFPLAGILSAAFFGLAFGALASLIPARQAARLEIVEALRYE